VTDHDAVLFDLDGVLVDSRVPFTRGINSALVAHGLPERPEEELHQYLGPPLNGTFATLVGDPSLVQPCIDAYRARYRELGASESTVFPGIRELLEAVGETRPLVVATSKPRPMAEPLLDALGLSVFFDAIVGPDLGAEDEEKTVTLGRALQHFAPRVRPVMVGDRKYDVIAAHAHAIPAIGVLWGIGSQDELRAAGADELVATPGQLATLFAAL
jgi:phosphoglycolate phosphatase